MRGWSSRAALTPVQLPPAARPEPGAPSREHCHRAPGVPGLDSHVARETLSGLKRERRCCQRMTPHWAVTRGWSPLGGHPVVITPGWSPLGGHPVVITLGCTTSLCSQKQRPPRWVLPEHRGAPSTNAPPGLAPQVLLPLLGAAGFGAIWSFFAPVSHSASLFLFEGNKRGACRLTTGP